MSAPNWEKHADNLIGILLTALGTWLHSLLSRSKENIVTYEVTGPDVHYKETVEVRGIRAKHIDGDYIKRLEKIDESLTVIVISKAPL